MAVPVKTGSGSFESGAPVPLFRLDSERLGAATTSPRTGSVFSSVPFEEELAADHGRSEPAGGTGMISN